jgi:N-hydroxyarylamine O-acetyltransferase
MNLQTYLKRIGYTGNLEPNLETLNALQAAHLSSIPYENLDIHLGRTLPIDETRAYQKLVLEKRGGWCYEMNTLFAWALRQIGFEVRYLSSGVLRLDGNTPDGDHLILLVNGTYLADVGFGDGAIHALPLETGRYRAGFLEYGISFEAGFWTMHNFPQSNTAGFVFRAEARDLGYFAQRCHSLQTSPESGFVRTTVCQRMTKDALYTLRGAVLTTLTASGKLEQTLTNYADYKNTLLEKFRLELPETQTLWEKIWARHEAWTQLAQN